MPESILLPALDPETGSLLRPEDIAFFESCTEGHAGYFYRVLGHLYQFIEQGVSEGRFTEQQARQDLQIALWHAYACNNIGEYLYYYRSAAWMPDSEPFAAGCGAWYYRYACALTNCGRLDEARRYAEQGVQEEPGYPWGWLQLAKLRAHFQDKAGALDAVARGLALVPGDYEFLTLRDEILAGASLEQMEYHWIDPGADGALQEGLDSDADKKLQAIACITTDPKGLARFRSIFHPGEDYEANCPYCSFSTNVQGHTVEVVFQMNEAALSKLDAGWLRTQKQRLNSGRWLQQRVSLYETGLLDTVLFGLGRTVSLIYRNQNPAGEDRAYFQLWLDAEGNPGPRPDGEPDD